MKNPIILKVRSFLGKAIDRIRNEKLKRNLLQAVPFWTASLITGLFAVFYAQAFAQTERLTATIFRYHPWILFIISPASFFLARWIVKRFAPFSRGSGIPQTLAAVEMASDHKDKKINNLLGVRVILIKVLSSLLMAFGGGAVGREGPIIHISGSVFSKIYDILPDWWPRISRKNMIMTGAAAGLAAAFNTPLGGIVFAIEELTKVHLSDFKTAIFTAVIIAGLTVQSLLGSYLYLGFPAISSLSSYILFGVILVAIIAGILGSGMGKLIWLIFKWKAKFNKEIHHIGYLLLGSLSIVLMAYLIDANALGSGKSLMMSTLFSDNKYSEWYMPLLRIIGPVLSFTSGAAGGIFAPGLCAGGSVGSVLSGWMTFSPSDTNLMILAGMVAFLTGITRAPFTSAILVLEMTDRNNLILHLMLASIIASIVSMIIDKHSLYDYLKTQYIREMQQDENGSLNDKKMANQ